MKNIFYICACCILFSCNASKKSSQNKLSSLDGTWQLNYITGPRITFDGLYPAKKPSITFTVKKKRVAGNTSCNSFSGPLNADEEKISFSEPMALTKMACMGPGESVFLETLKKVNKYDVTAGYTLTLLMDDVAMMRFTKTE